jgi:hypothetical protein
MNSTPAEFGRALRLVFGAAVSADETGMLLKTEGVALHFALYQRKSKENWRTTNRFPAR